MSNREDLISSFLEVKLKSPEDFLRVRETLTRIGLTNKEKKTLNQTCLIFHKKGRYYIVHFLEMFAMDGKDVEVSLEDIQRRNRIAALLQDWGFIDIVNPEAHSDMIPMNRIKILGYEEKDDWTLKSMYSIGKKYF